MDTVAGADQIAAVLSAAGIRAVVDPARINAPCVWVYPSHIEHDVNAGGGYVTYHLWALGVGQGALETLVSAEQLRQQIEPWLPIETADFESVPATTGLGPLAGWHCLYRREEGP